MLPLFNLSCHYNLVEVQRNVLCLDKREMCSALISADLFPSNESESGAMFSLLAGSLHRFSKGACNDLVLSVSVGWRRLPHAGESI